MIRSRVCTANFNVCVRHMNPESSSSGPVKAFLDMDPPIRGQRFACVSFLNPEDIILSREQFGVHRFLAALGTDTLGMFDSLAKIYADKPAELDMIKTLKDKYAYLNDPRELQAFYGTFTSENADRLDTEFADYNGGLTSVRALKIRGVYDTIEEAKERSKDLRAHDKGLFNIYVAQVGCWLPWSPNPDEIADSVYADQQLNVLMDRYRENSKQRDELYAQRKDLFRDRLTEGDDADGLQPDGVSVSVVESTAEHAALFDAPPVVSEDGKVL